MFLQKSTYILGWLVEVKILFIICIWIFKLFTFLVTFLGIPDYFLWKQIMLLYFINRRKKLKKGEKEK